MEKIFFTENRRKYVILVMVIAGVYLFLRFLSPIFSPFIAAFLIAGLLSRLAGKLPLKINKQLLAGVVLVLALALILIVVSLFGGWAVQKCAELAGELSVYEEDLSGLLDDCCRFMESSFGIDGTAVENYVLEQVNIFVENLEVTILPAMMNRSLLYVKGAAKVLGFLAVSMIAVFLFLKDYDGLLAYLKGNEDFQGILEVAEKILIYLKTYLKAQLTILLIIAAICAGGLWLLGIEGGVLYGIFTGFMDMLPFIGTGIMLMPLAFFQLLSENYWRAALLVCLYAVCALIREFLEPKLIGSKVGIWPVGILFSVFAGVKLFGIFGIIKGPVGLVVICESCKYLFREKESHGKENC